jgi:chemotaxis protein methyltransferase CheR
MELMVSKVSELMAERGIDSPLDYFYLVKYEEAVGGEWLNLVNAISVRESYFWREHDQLRALVNVVIPCLADSTRKPIRIWSAACASGEEPVSIAMTLAETGWLDRIPLEIHASDLSPFAIATAERGVYRERAFRTLPPDLRQRYFTPAGQDWKVNADLHRRIQWHHANLTNESDIDQLARSHVIFCRNVFIYFSEATIRKVVKVLAERMPRPGYLFVGAAESLLKLTSQFQLQQIEGAFVYVSE